MRITTLAVRAAGCLCLLLTQPLLLLHAEPATAPDAVTPDGGRYYGALVDGMRQGHGRVEWRNGARYEGGFDQGLYSGRGKIDMASGFSYEGEFERGMMTGRGRMQLQNGATYVGAVRNGEFDGQGRYQSAKGELYEGGFAMGRYQGQGRFENPAGEVYEGNFENNELSGTGRSTHPDGSRYQGNFLKWKPHGKGSFVDAQGNRFEGEFVNGALTGPGKMNGKNGSSYDGEFKQWAYHGEGVFRYANGDEYKGAFAQGAYDGKGTLTYATAQKDGRTVDSGIWHRGSLENKEEELQSKRNVETALYNQRAFLDRALAALAPRDPKKINMYLLAVAGDGSQEVFRREVEFVQEQFDRDFGTRGRSLALINSRSTVDSAPMATLTSIRESLHGVAGRMDKERDILFLFLTSHGSRDHEITLDQNGMELRGLPAKELGAALKESGIRWKVVVVSACFAGGFIDAIKDEHTLVIAAARHDRTSFGCSDDNDFTYFGRAFFKDALPRSSSFEEAFQKAKVLVEQWEADDIAHSAKDDKIEHSLPQMHDPVPVKKYLQRWQAQLPKSPAPRHANAAGKIAGVSLD